MICSDSAVNLYRKLKNDKAYRQIFTVFAWSCFAFLVLGWNLGLGGPTLLDLQIIANCSLEQASLFFTAIASGYMVSSLVIGVTFDRFDKFLHIIFGNVGITIVMAAIPWCKYYELMFTIHVLKGFLCGFSDGVASTILIHLLGQDCRRYIQILHFFFTIGGMLSPLAAAPFLNQLEGSNMIKNESYNGLFDMTTLRYNISNVPTVQNSHNLLILRNTSDSSITTEVYKPYLISAGLSLLSVVPFAVMYLTFDKKLMETKQKKLTKEDKNCELPILLRIPVLLTVALCSLVYTALEDSFASFLATFAVKQYQWDKSVASYATSLYWASFSGGSLIGIFIAPLFDLSKFLTFYSLMIVSSFTVLLLTTLYGFDGGIWASAAISGFFMSVFFPLFFAWTEEDFLHVSARVTALIMLSGSSGVIINPIILGKLMEVSPVWFCYILLGESIVLFLLFCVGTLLSKRTKKIRMMSELEIRVDRNGEIYENGNTDAKVNKGFEITKF
ncbi:sodium-dependent glucose transporter 1A-like [Mytilus edulis]|uniref:sodium-dependent glucose transporter 1A-like n=1 Tax=Mytilus edulis TaxID=6550 RepID=UPI0039F09C36